MPTTTPAPAVSRPLRAHPRVIRRIFPDPESTEFTDNEASWEEAETLAGRRLDHRRNYAIIDGEVYESAIWSQACSGCYEGVDVAGAQGNGCSDCGWTGRRRRGQWLPLQYLG